MRTVWRQPTPEGAAAWRQGWLARARVLGSPNFGPRPEGAQVSLIVVHSISLPPGRFEGEHVQALFTNALDWRAHPDFRNLRDLKVSSHFYVRRSGELWQFVDCDERAWHAGVSRHRGRVDCNDFSVGIELEGLEGGVFEAAQYEELARLCRELRVRYPIDAIAGHEHIAPGRKHDPGAGFDWQALHKMLGWPKSRFPRRALAPRRVHDPSHSRGG